MKPKVLVVGSTGRLGAYLVPELERSCEVIRTGRRAHSDILYPITIKDECDLVVDLAAYTNVVRAETEKLRCFQTNVDGTFNLVEAYKDKPFVYISTEYAKNPLGVYATSKYLAEQVVKTHPHHLIIRTSFKPTPWPFPFAYEDQMTQGDYVDVIAKLLAKKITNWNGKNGLVYVGTGRKTILELAQRTRPDVKPNKVDDYVKQIGLNIIPHDYR
ncbi:MAG: sugar nucleotide-binding protein [Sphaerochaeta sp.]|jgi:dTDP-4-dehydrorhamnose reductase|nr:sugar nucleotide-binding protein [Sphaerochaeta sp.]